MKVINLTEAKETRSSLIGRVQEESGTDVRECYQCGKCSGGCPVSFAMDYHPHQIMRLIQLGLKEKAFQSATIWICACCYTCSTRCPRQVDVAGVMEALVIMAQKEGYPPRESRVAVFHNLFLDIVRANGRIHELGLMQRYRLRTGGLFNDLGLGWQMLRRGRLKLGAHRIRGAGAVREIFARIRDLEASKP